MAIAPRGSSQMGDSGRTHDDLRHGGHGELTEGTEQSGAKESLPRPDLEGRAPARPLSGCVSASAPAVLGVLRVWLGLSLLLHSWGKLAAFATTAAQVPGPLGIGGHASLALTGIAIHFTGENRVN